MAKIIGNTTATTMPLPDWSQNNPAKADYIKNRPFYEVSGEDTDTLTWDGNTEGLDSVDALKVYRVSDKVPTLDDFVNGCIITYEENGTSQTVTLPAEYFQIFSDRDVIGEGEFYVIPYDNYLADEEENTRFPKAGVYFVKTEEMYIQSITIHGYNFATTTIKQLDEKFIPDTIARKTDIPEHTWKSLPDKPFGEEIALGDTLTWDGNAEGRITVEFEHDVLCHISDIVPSYEDITDGVTLTLHSESNDGVRDYNMPSEELKFVIDTAYTQAGIVYGNYFIAIPEDNYELLGTTFPKAGLYGYYEYWEEGNEYYKNFLSSLTIPGYGKFEGISIKTIDPKYLPDNIGAQPDWDETDETSPSYIRNKPDENDALLLVAEMGLVQPVSTASGDILTDNNNNIIIL